jgi:endonuclease-3 related protein
MTLSDLYRQLMSLYGPRGWWPVITDGSGEEYHKSDYSFPRNEEERFQICAGAVLTQNTAWKNVRLALLGMKEADVLDIRSVREVPTEKLAALIRPAGYFNQKALRLKVLAAFLENLNGRTPEREELLALNGIGPETADCIRLYAYGCPDFVIDAYTRRFLAAAGLIDGTETYDSIKAMFEDSCPPDTVMYQEFHALFVVHGKAFYSRRPRGEGDPLLAGVSSRTGS